MLLDDGGLRGMFGFVLDSSNAMRLILISCVLSSLAKSEHAYRSKGVSPGRTDRVGQTLREDIVGGAAEGLACDDAGSYDWLKTY
jgi:hypothetical protein